MNRGSHRSFFTIRFSVNRLDRHSASSTAITNTDISPCATMNARISRRNKKSRKPTAGRHNGRLYDRYLLPGSFSLQAVDRHPCMVMARHALHVFQKAGSRTTSHDTWRRAQDSTHLRSHSRILFLDQSGFLQRCLHMLPCGSGIDQRCSKRVMPGQRGNQLTATVRESVIVSEIQKFQC